MLHLDLTLDIPDLPVGSPARRHLIARLRTPAEVETADRPPLDLAIVIDASGSMSGAPIDAARQATLEIAAALPPETRLTVVSFADDVVVHAHRCLLDERGRGDVHASVAGLRPRGRTDLHAGWETACALLDAAPTEGGRRRHVVVLSDGMANRGIVDPLLLSDEARRVLDRGITTSCVGFGDRYSTTQLAALAEHGGGECHDAESAPEIVEILLGEVLSLAEVCADDVRLILDVPEGVHAAELSGMPGTLHGRRLVVQAGSVRAGVDRTIVVRLEIDAAAKSPTSNGAVELVGHVEWTEPGMTARSSSPPAGVRAERSHSVPARPSLADARAVLVAWQAYLTRTVSALNRDHDFDGLERLWHDEFEPFREYACAHAELAECFATVRLLRRRSARPMPERMRKQTVDTARKVARNVRPHYSANKGQLFDQLGDA